VWLKGKRFISSTTNNGFTQNTPTQTISARVITAEQVPNIKIKDFFSSLINQFNLIIKPEEGNLFHIDTLDNGI
jgi:hypothetical protein